MPGRVSLALPASASAMPLAEAVAVRLCAEAGVEGDGTERLVAAVRCLVAFSVERSHGGAGGGDVELGLELDERGIAVDVHDWGVPMRRAGGPDGPLPEGLEAPPTRRAAPARALPRRS
ncbi:MAG: ATP-binding protein [Actinobacteria bacterium]|nr:ATP-binding protein [Actinomycetota bacterium]